MSHTCFLSVACFATLIGHGVAEVASADKFLHGSANSHEAEAVSLESVKSVLTSISQTLSSSHQEVQDAAGRLSKQDSTGLLREGPLAPLPGSDHTDSMVKREAALDEHLAEIVKRHGLVESKKADVGVVRHISSPDTNGGNTAMGTIGKDSAESNKAENKANTDATQEYKNDATQNTKPDQSIDTKATATTNGSPNDASQNAVNTADTNPTATEKGTDGSPEKVQEANKPDMDAVQAEVKGTADPNGKGADVQKESSPVHGETSQAKNSGGETRETGITATQTTVETKSGGKVAEVAEDDGADQVPESDGKTKADSKTEEKDSSEQTDAAQTNQTPSENKEKPDSEHQEKSDAQPESDGVPPKPADTVLQKASQTVVQKNAAKLLGVNPDIERFRKDALMLEEVKEAVDQTADQSKQKKSAEDVSKKVMEFRKGVAQDQLEDQKKVVDAPKKVEGSPAVSSPSLLAGFDTLREHSAES